MDALLFDFDGLILDTETPELEVWEQVFADYGVAFPIEYWLFALGRGAEQIHEKPIDLLKRAAPRIDAESVNQFAREIRLSRIMAAEPMPGVVELMREARAQKIPTAVVSSSKHPWVDGHLERLGLAHFFDLTICADDAEHAKPFPDLYELALRRLSVAASHTVALEDSPNGLTAATAAGIFAVAVPNPLTARLDLSHASALLATLSGISVKDLAALAGLSLNSTLPTVSGESDEHFALGEVRNDLDHKILI